MSPNVVEALQSFEKNIFGKRMVKYRRLNLFYDLSGVFPIRPAYDKTVMRQWLSHPNPLIQNLAASNA